MSVINQMLIGLEKRGVQSATDQVRPVHEEAETSKMKWLLIVVLIASLALSAWYFLPLPLLLMKERELNISCKIVRRR